MDVDAVKFNCVSFGEAHHRSIRDIHPSDGSSPNVLHELLYVLGGDGWRNLELQNNGVIHFQIQTPDEYGNRTRQRENIHFSETWNAAMVQIDLQHALVESLG